MEYVKSHYLWYFYIHHEYILHPTYTMYIPVYPTLHLIRNVSVQVYCSWLYYRLYKPHPLIFTTLLWRIILPILGPGLRSISPAHSSSSLSHPPLFPRCREIGYKLPVTFALCIYTCFLHAYSNPCSSFVKYARSSKVLMFTSSLCPLYICYKYHSRVVDKAYI